MPRLFDELGPIWNRKPVREQYQDVIRGDRDMRHLVGDIPSFLLRADLAEQMVDKPWLDIARRSLAITAAEKVSLYSFNIGYPSRPTRTDHTNPPSFPFPLVSNIAISTYAINMRQCGHNNRPGVRQYRCGRQSFILGTLCLLRYCINNPVSSVTLS